MSKDQNAGKSCLITLNVILIILSCLLLGLVIYIGRGNSELHPMMEALKSFQNMMIFVAVVLFVVGVVGICAAFGGCFLLIYTVAVTVISIVCIALLAFFIYAFFVTKKNPEGTSSIFELVDNKTLEFIEKNPEPWVKIQDTLECCGYKNVESTQTSEQQCKPASGEIKDCRIYFVGALTDYIGYTVIAMAVITIVVIAINCASCKAMKNFCGN